MRKRVCYNGRDKLGRRCPGVFSYFVFVTHRGVLGGYN